MEAYFARDLDPHGGHLDIYRELPVVENQRRSLQEIRKADFPAETWLGIMFAEIKPDPEHHYDVVFQPYFDGGTVVWTREGGYVNGTE